MKENIKYLKWRSHIDDVTLEDYRIGDNVLLIKEADAGSATRFIGNNPFKLDVSMAIIYEKGEAVTKINMREYHIKAPAVMVIMHGQICMPISSSDDLRSKAIVLSSSFTDSLFTASEESLVHDLYSSVLQSPLIADEKDIHVFHQYYELLLNIARSPLSEFKLESARHLTLAMFYGYTHIKHDVATNNICTTRQEEIYNEFLEHLSRYYKQARDVGFYADKLCITAKHLSQVVKEVSGRTALEIIEEYVLTECKALLLSSTMTVQQIGDELNFPSQSVFGKYFKRLTGLSPKAYRNQICR